MFRKRRIEKKLDLLLQRQCMIMDLLTSIHCSNRQREKNVEKWNKLWYKIMEGKE